MNTISIIILPLIVLFIIIYGVIKKVDLYDSFVVGAKEGLTMTLNIFPFIIGMVFAVNIFVNSGFIEFLFSGLGDFLGKYNLSISLLPMCFLRPISGTATLVLLNNILSLVGPDSFSGVLASTIQGCTDTTFYVITLYFGSVGVYKIRHSLKVGLLSDLISIIASFVIVSLMFS